MLKKESFGSNISQWVTEANNCIALLSPDLIIPMNDSVTLKTIGVSHEISRILQYSG